VYYRSLHRRKLVTPGYIVENLYNDLIIGLLYFSYAIIVLFTVFLNRIWYYLQLIAIYLSSPSGASQSPRTPKSTCFERFNFWNIYRRLRSGMQTKHLLIVLTFLMTQCSLQLCLCLFCNQTRRFIYRSGARFYTGSAHIEKTKPCMQSIYTTRLSNEKHGQNIAVL